MDRADPGSSHARVGSLSEGLANEVCGSSDRSRGAPEEIKPLCKVCIPPIPPIMRAPREGQRGSVLFHPTSHFAKSAVAKNDTVLRYRKGLMRRDKRNWSACQAEGCT